MGPAGPDSSATRHLQLVEPQTFGLAALSHAPSLRAPRCRPTEWPVAVVFRPSTEGLELARERALTARVPVELWVRLAIDTERLLEELVATGVASRYEFAATLDLASVPAPSTDVVAVPGPLAEYVRAIRGGDPGTPPGDVLELLLPEDLAGRWSQAASSSGAAREEWMERHLAASSGNPVIWEIAAAEKCLTLTEWCYASALKRVASLTAMAS